jgi:hypothetical protein
MKLTIFRTLRSLLYRLVRRKRIWSPPQVLYERLTICHTCEFRSGMACSICGCLLQAKARLVAEQCPIDKWATHAHTTAQSRPAHDAAQPPVA